MVKQSSLDETTLRIAAQLMRQAPKRHKEMKLGKRKGKSAKSPKRRKAVKSRKRGWAYSRSQAGSTLRK